MRSIHEHIGAAYDRVRLGIGHPGRKELVSAYVLSDFAKADAEWLEDVLRGVSDGAPYLASGDGGKFMNAVALRTAPPRSSTTQKPAENSTPAKRPEPRQEPEPDTRSAMQKLLDKFK